MEEVRQILNSYKGLKAKTEYLKSYFECLNLINKKSGDLLLRASQIPRDTSWNDPNIVNLVEMGERQRQIYDTDLFKTIFSDLNELKGQINEDILMIETNLGDIINKNNSLSRELDLAKKSHIESWLRDKDPWLTDIKLKMAIKNMYTSKESTPLYKISIYNDKFLNTQDLYNQILVKYSNIQKSLFTDLRECNIKIHNILETERYFDAQPIFEITESKILNAYEGIIQNISTELIKRDISIYKNIEPIKYGMCKIRKGLTGDWMLYFVSVTKSGFVHLFDISCLEAKIIQKYSNILGKLKQPRNISLVSIFDTKKPAFNVMDERCLSLLAEEIRNNIDKLIDKICLSINLKDKITKIDKDKNVIIIDEKLQNGISSLFGINVVRIKAFSLTSCYELYFSMKKPAEESLKEAKESKEKRECNEKKECNEKREEFKECNEVSKETREEAEIKGMVVKIEEDNPWE